MSFSDHEDEPIRDRIGDVLVYQRDGSFVRMPPDAYGALCETFRGGLAFYEGRTFYGAMVVIKMAEVNAISLNTPESIVEAEADEQRERAKRKRFGFLDERD